MTTLKAIVRKPRTDGLYSVYIRIVHNRKPGYIKTDKIVDANHVFNGEIILAGIGKRRGTPFYLFRWNEFR